MESSKISASRTVCRCTGNSCSDFTQASAINHFRCHLPRENITSNLSALEPFAGISYILLLHIEIFFDFARRDSKVSGTWKKGKNE